MLESGFTKEICIAFKKSGNKSGIISIMKTKTLSIAALLLLGAIVFSGCSAKKPPFDYDPSYDTQKLASFTLQAEKEATHDPLNSDRIKEAIEKALFEKGYEEASALGDFTVMYGMKIYKNRPDPVTFGIGLGGISGNFGGSIFTSVTPKHDEISLFVRMVDPKTKKVFWSSSVTKKWKGFDPAKREETIDEAVRQMLQYFPKRGRKEFRQ